MASERARKTSFNSLPKWQDWHLPAHAPSTEVVCNAPVSFDYFIPICKAPSVELLDTTSDARILRSPSIGYPSPLSCLPSTYSVHSKRAEHRSTKLRKSYDCLVCHESFTRPSDLRTHENMHTGRQPFRCNFQGCPKKFGVRSNLQRHQVVHGIPRTGRSRPVAEYKVKFEPLPPCPSLLSDTIPMAAQVIWDNEGPFSRQPVHWPVAQTVGGHQDNGRTSSAKEGRDFYP